MQIRRVLFQPSFISSQVTISKKKKKEAITPETHSEIFITSYWIETKYIVLSSSCRICISTDQISTTLLVKRLNADK